MRKAKIAPALVNEWIERTGLPWPRAIAALGLVLILLLVSAIYLDHGVLPNPFSGGFLRDLEEPTAIVFILLAYRLLERLGNGAIEAFRPLMAIDDDDFDQLLAGASPFDRRREWLAMGIVAAAGLLLNRPWNWGGPHAFWWKLWGMLATILAFGFFGGLIYRSLAYTRLLTELHRQPLDIDILDPTPLEPVARFSLGISLTFIGGTTLRLLFNPDPRELLSIQSLIIYGTMILVSVLVFFLTLMSTHRVMAEVKERELKLVRGNLSAAYQEWKEQNAKGQLQDMEALSYAITAGLAYRKVIEEAPEWPYTTGTLRNLLMSTLLPVAAWIAQVLVEFIT
jgi:hypothetical protein